MRQYQYYLSKDASKVEQDAFQAGCRALITIFRNTPPEAHPSIWASVSKQHITATLLKYADQTTTQHDQDASTLLSRAIIHKPTARAFIFDVGKINDEGQEIDQYGRPIEGYLCTNPDPAAHTSYDKCQAIHNTTGQVIRTCDYSKLAPYSKGQYSVVRYFEATIAGGNIPIPINSADRHLMSALIHEDILINDPGNNYRYLLAMADDGVLADYRDAISGAIAELGESTNITPMLLAHANNGTIRTGGHLIIAQIQSFLHAAKLVPFLKTIDPKIVDIWLDLFELCTHNSGYFLPYITEDDFATYLNINNFPLPGAICLGGESQQPKWIAYPSTPGHANNSARYNYFKHVFMPEFAKKLLKLLDYPISTTELDFLPPDTFRSILKLARYLISNYADDAQYPTLRELIAHYAAYTDSQQDET